MALLEFYGESCPHCMTMKPLVAQLESEMGIKVETFEVWNSDENAKKYDEIDCGECGGVPFFYNTESKKKICGAATYDVLKAWAQGE